MHRMIQSDSFTVCCKTKRIILTCFDYANHIKPGGSNAKVGTVCWMAPELIKGKQRYT